ncbi:MAG: tetratricopeptide repeat protein [Anaerolineae bacterium]|nr:tetratricopeptide repeat protein [Anaerolineae bacterium]
MGLLDDKRSAKQQPDEDLWEGLFDEEELEAPPEPEEAPSEKKGRARREGRGKREKHEKKPSKRESRRAAKRAAAAAKPKRARAEGKGLKPAQLLLLLLLAVFVVVAYFLLASMIKKNLSAPPSGDETVAPVSTEAASVEAATSTLAPPTPTRTPGPTRTPAPTPTPAPPVATQFDQHIAANPDNVDMRLQRGAEYLRLGAYTAALEDFQHARDVDDKRFEAYLGIGQANYQLCDWPAAENAFLMALALNPSLSDAHFGIGMLYYLQGRYREAAKEFDQAAEIHPTYAEAEAWLAIASAQVEDAAEAMGAAGRAISLTEESAIVHIARSWAYLVQSPPDIDAAQSDLLYAQKLDPYNFELLVALARFYTDYRPERIVEAEQLGNYAIQWAKGDLEHARALHALGHVYLAQDRKEEAKKVLAEAADLMTYEGQVLLFGVIEDLNRALAP